MDGAVRRSDGLSAASASNGRLAASLFGALFERAHVGMLLTDAGGLIQAVNPAFCAITGYSVQEVIGINPRLLQSGEHDTAFYTQMWSALQSCGFWTGEIWNRRRDASLVAELLTIVAVRDESGTTTHYVGVFSDITALKSHERWVSTQVEAMRGAEQRRAELATLAQALAAGEFRLFYQPQVEACTGRVIGVEALMRWQHPQRGLLLPGEFLHQVESDTALVQAFGEWTLAQAVAQLAVWTRAGLALTVGVNVFARHLDSSGFVAYLDAVLLENPAAPPGLLQLEVVESVALEDVIGAGAVLERCRLLGVSVALDDFGTGYSSLTYLRRLAADVIKIDRSFVQGVLDDRGDDAIVAATIELARAFHRRTIAEGVETLAHGRHLRALGCDALQGFGIARPMPPENIAGWIVQFRLNRQWAALSLNQP